MQPLVLRMLIYLVRHRERVVKKSELRLTVWNGVTVGDGSFNQAISLLRKAIGDDAAKPTMLETVRGHGYRFVTECREVAPELPVVRERMVEQSFVVGRDADLAAIEGAYLEALDGHAGLMLVGGEAGVGKTALLDAAAERLTGSGAWALFGRCREDRKSSFYWPWPRIVRSLLESPFLDSVTSETLSVLWELLPELRARNITLRVPTRPSEEARERAFDALVGLFEAACERQPLAIFLDDLHSASEPAREILKTLLERTNALPLFVCAAYQLGENVEIRGLESPETHHILLRGLGAGAAGDLLERRLGRRPSDAVCRWAQRMTGGSPLLMLAVARRLSELGQNTSLEDLEGELPLPEEGASAVRALRGNFPEAALDALAVASVLGREPLVRHIASLLDVELKRATELLAPAIERGLVRPVGGDRVAFAHELFRQDAQQSLPLSRRNSLHARAAACFDAEVDRTRENKLEAAHHHYLAGTSADPDAALHSIETAAEDALACFAFEDAALWYSRALKILEYSKAPSGARSRLLLGRGSALGAAGRVDDAIGCFLTVTELARAEADAESFARAALAYAAAQDAYLDFTLVACLREALAQREAHPPQTICALEAELAFALRQTPDEAEGLALARRAVEAARETRDPLLLSRALNALRWNAPDVEDVLAISEAAVEVANQARAFRIATQARIWRAADLLRWGRIQDAETEIESLSRAAEKSRRPVLELSVLRLVVTRELMRGDFRVADALAERALRLGRARSEGTTELYDLCFRVLVRREQGRLGELHDFVQRVSAFASHQPAFRALLAWIEAEQGNTRVATDMIDALQADALAHPQNFNTHFVFTMMAWASLSSGHRSAARFLLERLAPYRDRHVVVGPAMLYLGPTRLHLAIAAGLAGDLDDARVHAQAAIEATPHAPYQRLQAEIVLARFTPDDTARRRIAEGASVDAEARGYLALAEESRALIGQQ